MRTIWLGTRFTLPRVGQTKQGPSSWVGVHTIPQTTGLEFKSEKCQGASLQDAKPLPHVCSPPGWALDRRHCPFLKQVGAQEWSASGGLYHLRVEWPSPVVPEQMQPSPRRTELWKAQVLFTQEPPGIKDLCNSFIELSYNSHFKVYNSS